MQTRRLSKKTTAKSKAEKEQARSAHLEHAQNLAKEMRATLPARHKAELEATFTAIENMSLDTTHHTYNEILLSLNALIRALEKPQSNLSSCIAETIRHQFSAIKHRVSQRFGLFSPSNNGRDELLPLLFSSNDKEDSTITLVERLKDALFLFDTNMPTPATLPQRHHSPIRDRSTVYKYEVTSYADEPAELINNLNFSVIDPTHHIAATVLMGQRYFQEDRFVFNPLSIDGTLTDNDWKTVLKNTIATLASEVEQEKISGGSCLISNIVTSNRIYTASVGDSVSYLFIKHANGRTELIQLNPILHTPEDEKELARLTAFAKEKKVPLEKILTFNSGAQRLNGTLSLSRAIGDIGYDQYGLISTPDITAYPLSLAPDSCAVLITACDGLIEQPNTEYNLDLIIRNTIANATEIDVDQLATTLAFAAYNDGSSDNLTIIASRINPQRDTVTMQSIFDGHMTDLVSEYLRKNYPHTLQKYITQQLQPQTTTTCSRP